MNEANLLNKRVVFCMICGECLGEENKNGTQKHSKKHPSHNDFLVRKIVDPLLLPNLDEWLSIRNSRINRLFTGIKSTEDGPVPMKDGFKYYIGSLLYRRIRKCQAKK